MLTLQDVRNHDIAIHSLPPEILAQIFLYTKTFNLYFQTEWASEMDASNYEDIVLLPGFRWTSLVLGQVCQYWRQVALNSPRLWTEIVIGEVRDFCTVSRVQTYLSRSKQAPLKVFAMLGDQPSISAFRLVLYQFHRLQWLYLYIRPPPTEMDPEQPVLALGDLPTSAPQLQWLTMRPLYGAGLEVLPLFIYGTRIAPQLRELVFTDCLWRLSTHAFSPSLTSLQVTHLFDNTYTFSDVLNSLRPLSALTRLCLQGVLPPVPDLASSRRLIPI